MLYVGFVDGSKEFAPGGWVSDKVVDLRDLGGPVLECSQAARIVGGRLTSLELSNAQWGVLWHVFLPLMTPHGRRKIVRLVISSS